MKKNSKYPLKHVSIRVPWHDNGWNGTVCNEPKKNNACLILKNCALNRDDELEERVAGKNIQDLSQDEYPCCINERGTFMGYFSVYVLKNHPYTKFNNKIYEHFLDTPLKYPAYSAAGVPFYWMMKDKSQELAKLYDLDFDLSKEPELNFETNWLQEYSNQKTMLNCFFEHFERDNSLCFFYAKDVPFVEKSGRVLIGIGRLKYVSDGVEYDYSAKGGLRNMLWEHMIQHSIRPDFKDGFLLPYHEALKYAEENYDFNPEEIAVITPTDKMKEFSFATEHVSNDTAIRTLLSCVKGLERASELKLGERDWEEQLKWIESRINELEKIRGNYPGLGSALCAFGLEKGHFIAREIVENAGTDDPWVFIDKLFDEPEKVISEPLVKNITPMLKKRWKYHKEKKGSDRLELLQLISRFDITIEQAKSIYIQEERTEREIHLSDLDMLKNPYLIYEFSGKLEEPISLWTIDLGMFNTVEDNIELLPRSVKFKDRMDERRIRALTVYKLSSHSTQGHTLVSRNQLVQEIRGLSLRPECPLASDVYEIAEDVFEGAINKVQFEDGSYGYQLIHLYKMKDLIEKTVSKRVKGKRHRLVVNWRKLLDGKFGELNPDDKSEEMAREEKAKALQEISESRFSVLVGPAGTGKTTILSVLCEQEEIKKDGVLFLAPTGKARVRMKECSKELDITALTLAQFLNKYDRYDAKKMSYQFSDFEKCTKYGTVIVDESSMLTEEMLAALLDCLKGVQRLILVGDYRQLPPIGPGRPFVDIVHFIREDSIENKFPRVSDSYAELTISGRHRGDSREDMILAKWFSGSSLDTGDDGIFQDIMLNKGFKNIKFVPWQEEENFEETFLKLLIEELELENISDIEGFNKKLGSDDGKFFNDSLKAKHFRGVPAVEKIDDWQILSPIRSREHGVNAINRMLHKIFRKDSIDYAKGLKTKFPPNIPKPLGNEEIIYGDKVINVVNQTVRSKNRVYPQDGLKYLANGEMGIVTGQYKTKKHKYKGQPQYTEVEFSSQKGFKYTFFQSDFTEEGNSSLELGYAITIHKAQGSDFVCTFIIVPDPCFILSRELLYTALTRHKEKVVILFQGDNILNIKEYSSPRYSETASRITNLFKKPQMRDINGKYLEEYLIHCASDNTLLRSKSELIIYEKLLQKGLSPTYEKELTLGGNTKIPDFTIIDEDTGETYYWEHCGMLSNLNYRMKWEEKKKWYYDHGIFPLEDGGGPNGTLIFTQDSSEQGISIPELEKIMERII